MYADDLEVMVRGWFALAELDSHSTSAGIPFVPHGGAPEAWCQDCSRFASALLRRVAPADALHLRCAQAQAWQRQVDVATEVAKAHGAELGLFPEEGK
jgi:hypothetical protein